MGMYDNFEEYMYGVLSRHNNSMMKMIRNLTNRLIELRRAPNLTEVAEISPDKLVPGRFYLILYDFNGNLMWCPILSLDYKVIKNKHILYAVNLEYLPPGFKIMLFDRIFRVNKNELDKISDNNNVLSERPLKYINFEFIYKILKNHKMNWAITAYTIKDALNNNYKIKKAYLCSIKIAPQIIMADFKEQNVENMVKLLKTLSNKDAIKLSNIIDEYKKLIESYQDDYIEYYKKIALFRDKLKLFDDED